MDIKEIGCQNVDWIHLAQDRVQRWALGFHKFWEISDWLKEYQLLNKDSAPRSSLVISITH
jgi:hypothetical protein